MTPALMFFWLLVGHGIADYPLQGDFLSRGKNHLSPLPGIPWYQCLFWHAMIHGGFVMAITRSWELGLLEVVVHFLIDHLKCNKSFGFNTDQALHVACKLAYAVAVQYAPGTVLLLLS